MRVLAITHPPDVPSVKYRILQLLPPLAKAGVEVERVDLPDGLMARLRLFRRAAEFDAVLHQKRLIPPWQFGTLRRNAKKLFYDFDDPMVYGRKNGIVTESATRISRFRRIVRVADAVVAGNAGLVAMAEEHGARRVEMIPTAVDLTRWIPRTEPGDGSVVGWVGSPANLPNLREIASALQGRTLRLVTDEPVDLPGVNVEFVKWEFATEPEQVRSFDVGIAPLPDDVWSRGKMPFKILYYFAAGVPVVASRCGAVESVIEHGRNGLLASSPEEWRAHLDALAKDPELRMRLGRAGRESVERGYRVEAAVEAWRRLFNGPR